MCHSTAPAAGLVPVEPRWNGIRRPGFAWQTRGAADVTRDAAPNFHQRRTDS